MRVRSSLPMKPSASVAVVPRSPSDRLVPCWQLPFSNEIYPQNLILLGMLLSIGYAVAFAEMLCGFRIHCLCMFSHGVHLLLDNVVLAGLMSSCLVHWRSRGRYSLAYVPRARRLNLAVGAFMYVGAVFVAYLGAWSLVAPFHVGRESLLYLVPLPAVLLNLVAVYVVRQRFGEDDDERVPEICVHLFCDAGLAALAVAASYLAQAEGFTQADAIFSMLLASVAVCCAMLLIREAVAKVTCVPDIRSRELVLQQDDELSDEVFAISH